MPHRAPSATKKSTTESRRYDRARYDEKRPSANERGYDAAWQKVRKHHLTFNPLCVDCLKMFLFIPAREVHHVIKVADRPDMRDVPSNMMSLCKRCHSVRTAGGE